MYPHFHAMLSSQEQKLNLLPDSTESRYKETMRTLSRPVTIYGRNQSAYGTVQLRQIGYFMQQDQDFLRTYATKLHYADNPVSTSQNESNNVSRMSNTDVEQLAQIVCQPQYQNRRISSTSQMHYLPPFVEQNRTKLHASFYTDNDPAVIRQNRQRLRSTRNSKSQQKELLCHLDSTTFISNQLDHPYDTTLSLRTEEIINQNNHDLEELSEWLHQESRQTIEQNRLSNSPHFTAMMFSSPQENSTTIMEQLETIRQQLYELKKTAIYSHSSSEFAKSNKLPPKNLHFQNFTYDSEHNFQYCQRKVNKEVSQKFEEYREYLLTMHDHLNLCFKWI